MERTILPGGIVFCPLIELKPMSISYCTGAPCPFFIRKHRGPWYGVIHCSQLKVIYEVDIERVCGNCQLTIKHDGQLICSPMNNNVYLKDGHEGWYAAIVAADEEACPSRFIPKMANEIGDG